MRPFNSFGFCSLRSILGLALALCLGLTALPIRAFDMQSHRGGRGLLPENTLAAFENAIRMGTTTIELDIAITSDGIPVVSHDPALNPAYTRDAGGQWLTRHEPLIKNMTLAEVQTYDIGRLNPSHPYAREFPEQQPRDGQRIPTLAALFKLVNDMGAKDLHFDMETKINPHHPKNTLPPEAFVRTLLKVIHEAGMTRRVMVQSFDWRTLELLHALEPEIRTMYLTVEWDDFNTARDPAWTAGHDIELFKGSVPHMVRASAGKAQGVIWAPNFKNLSHDLTKTAQSLGLKVIPWTVNDKPQMERLLGFGVDGIISDYPDRLRDVMAKHGMALPNGVNN
jgi:glycerophosphoryl diester phosphodiesterase